MSTDGRIVKDIPNGGTTRPDDATVNIESDSAVSNGHITIHRSYRVSPLHNLIHSEGFKTIVCFFYTHAALFIVEFAVAVVQFRIPDRKKHPPLPDIILDNLKRVTWGHTASEIMMILSSGICFILIFIHKYRLVMLRRWGCVMSVLFLARAITILLTALPVPSLHQECDKRTAGSWSEYYELSRRIASSRGFKLIGLRTCGDYMFSGHTVGLTLFTCLAREYTPQRWYLFHICMWICNLFGMYAIMAAHGHYSIDVFIAFILTYIIFHFYHSLANNRTSSRDRNRKALIFPFFDYFETDYNGIIPNTYEWPLRRKKLSEQLKNIRESLHIILSICKCNL